MTPQELIQRQARKIIQQKRPEHSRETLAMAAKHAVKVYNQRSHFDGTVVECCVKEALEFADMMEDMKDE